MALHRGRIDLLEEHLRRDPGILGRTFRWEEIYPPELGCHDEVLATHGTPLKGATLLHMAVDYDEFEIAEWLLARGMRADAKAAVDEDGFGGHTALFSTVVSQPNFWMNYQGGWAHSRKPLEARFTRLLLDHGADPNVRASLRKQLHPGYGPDTLHEYRDVTPLGWGAAHNRIFVSEPAMASSARLGAGIPSDSPVGRSVLIPTRRQEQPVKALMPLVVLLGAVLVAACAREAPGPEAAVEILSPADGDSVSLPLTIRLGAAGVEVVPATGQVEPGKGHHHLILDGDVPSDTVALPSPPVAIHLGTGAVEYTIDSLAPGPHRVIAVFAAGNHVAMRDVRRDTVHFIVR
jgi:hypothetical protein